MEPKLYTFNSSQDVVNLQTKYTLFKRVENILFYLSFEGGFDEKLMTESINTLIARHDCLRIKFIKKDGKICEFFEDHRTLDNIPRMNFKTWAQQDSFYKSFRKKKANCFKGDVLRAIFATLPDGQRCVFFKISHYVADTYGINLLVSDLYAIYESKKNGTPLPPAPGSFEQVLAKDLENKDNAELMEKDRAFFHNYYEVQHPDKPMYCSVHGSKSDEWLKNKRKGLFAMPYYIVKCDTDSLMLDIPSSVGGKARAWSEANGISMSSFFFYCFSIATSLLNDRAVHQTPLMLMEGRGTLAERKAAGTKVVPLSVYTTVDYDKSFLQNIQEAFAEQQELYKHTRLTYIEVETIQHKFWGHSMMSQTYGFSYSFIPVKMPAGVRMQILSNGKCSLTTYVALMFDVESNSIHVVYDYQTMLTNAKLVADFHNLFISVIEKVIADSNSELKMLF